MDALIILAGISMLFSCAIVGLLMISAEDDDNV